MLSRLCSDGARGCVGAWDSGGGDEDGEGLRSEADRNMSCHGGLEALEFLESGSE